jgi:hypothetical protein
MRVVGIDQSPVTFDSVDSCQPIGVNSPEGVQPHLYTRGSKYSKDSYYPCSTCASCQVSTIVLKVRLIRGCVTPLRLGMLCCQFCCVVPAMTTTSPADKVVLIFLVRSVLCRSTKSLGAPKDTDAMFGWSPYLQAREGDAGSRMGHVMGLQAAGDTSCQLTAVVLSAKSILQR